MALSYWISSEKLTDFYIMYEFDLKTLWSVITSKRKLLVRNCILGGIAAIIIAFSIPKEYSSETILAAEIKNETGIGGKMSSLAALAGFNLESGVDAIGPDLYPKVVSSNKFIVDILQSPVTSKDGKFRDTYINYLEHGCKSPWWSFPMVLLKKAIQAIKGSDKTPNVKINPECLSATEEGLVKSVRALIICQTDDEDGTISIKARAQDPKIAKTLVDSTISKLQNFITHYRTNKARIDLNYYQRLEVEALHKYQKAQQEYASYNDSHYGINLQKFINKRDALENEMQMAFTAYSQVKQQVQLANAKIQERTPAFTIVEAASISAKADSPRKLLILFAMVFLSFMGTLAYLYFKLLFSRNPELSTNLE